MENYINEKIITSAIIFPVNEYQDIFSQIFETHTSSGRKGLTPHITIAFPFYKTIEKIEENIDKLSIIIRKLKSKKIELCRINTFDDTGVLFLDPNDQQYFKKLFYIFFQQFNELKPYDGKFPVDLLTAHMTLAVENNANEFSILKDSIENEIKSLLPFIVNLNEIWVVVETESKWLKYKTFCLT